MSLAKKSIKWLVAIIAVFALVLAVSLAVSSGTVANATGDTEASADAYAWVADSAGGTYPNYLVSNSARTITVKYGFDIPDTTVTFTEFVVSPSLAHGNSVILPSEIVLNPNFASIAALDLVSDYKAGTATGFVVETTGAGTAGDLTCMVNNEAAEANYLFYAEYELPANATGEYEAEFGANTHFSLNSSDTVYIPTSVEKIFNIRSVIATPTTTNYEYCHEYCVGVTYEENAGYTVRTGSVISEMYANTYTATFDLDDPDSTVFFNGVDYYYGSYTASWEITPKTIYLALNGPFTSQYGDPIAATVSAPGVIEGDDSVNSGGTYFVAYYDETGQSALPFTPGEVGIYQIAADFEYYGNNYNFIVSEPEDYEVTPRLITIPTAGVDHLTYNGEVQTFAWSESPLTDESYFEVSGTTSATAASATANVVTVSLYDTDNTMWADNTTADKTYNWYIDKKAATLSFQSTSYSSTYGDYFEYPVIVKDGFVNTDIIGQDVSGMPNGSSNVGTYPLTITYNDSADTNYNITITNSATYTITTKYITIPVADPSAAPYYYTGSEITFAFTSASTVGNAYYTLANNVKTAVGNYTVTATLKDTTNTAWVGGGTAVQEYEFIIEYATIHVDFVGVYGESETTLDQNVEVNVNAAIVAPVVRWFKAGNIHQGSADGSTVTTYAAAMDGVTLYVDYSYAVGAGDVDGDGIITANDVLQMKRFMVGLDSDNAITTVASAWDKSSDTTIENPVMSSALDVNGSGTFRTNDIVAVREALATGYTYKVIVQEGVQKVISASVQEVGTYAAFKEKVLAGYPVKLINDITAAEEDFEVALTVPADIDLNGYTLTVNKFIMSNAYAGATLKVANSANTAATIFTVDGIGITAPLGNVIVNDFTGYIYEGSTVTLAAANHSLHIEGDVLFKDYAWESKSKEDAKADITNLVAAQSDVTANANPTPVEIPVDTHVVVEAAATLTVEKITVVEPMGEDSTANTFSIEVNNSSADVINVDVKKTDDVTSDYIVENVNQAGDISKINLITDTENDQGLNKTTGVKTEAEFRTALGESEKVLFGANISITSALEINADVVIDLNGFTLSSNLPTTRPVTVTANTTVTMENGAIYNGNTASYGLVENRGTLTLKNLTVDEYGADGGATFRNHSNATLTVKDCDMSAHGIAANQLLRNQNDSTGNTMLVEDSSFVSDSKTDYPIIIRGDGQTTFNRITVAGQMGAIVIEGNTVVITDSAFTDLTGKDYYGLWITNNYSGTNVTVNGGSFDGGIYGLYTSVDDGNQDESDVTITINGGTFTGGTGAIALGAKARNNSAHTWTININGGNFVGTDPSEFVAPNSVVTEKDGIYTVDVLAARIGEVYYETVQAAINNVKDGETIVLNRNVTDGTGLKTADDNSQHTKVGKTFTIDFNGFTYTVDGAAVGSSSTETQAMHWGEKDTITLKNGTFVVSEAAVTVPNPVTGKVVKMAMQNYANLTIKDMTMDFTNIPLNFYGENEFSVASGYSMYNGLEDPKFCTTYRATAALTIDNSTITLADSSTKGVHIEVPNAVIKDSTINGTVCLSTDGNNASVTITNSTVTKGVVGYFATDVITQNGDTYTVSSNS